MGSKNSRKITKPVESMDERRARQLKERTDALAHLAGIPEHRINRGDIEIGQVVDLSGELGGKRMSIVPVLINRGGTAVDRWIHRDTTGQFGEKEERAIRYAQSLWARLDGIMQAVDPAADIVDGPLGWSQQEALVEIKEIERRIPRPYWQCFENVCRFDEEAGVAGSELANNSRSAIDAARTCVAFTASLIADWRRL